MITVFKCSSDSVCRSFDVLIFVLNPVLNESIIHETKFNFRNEKQLNDNVLRCVYLDRIYQMMFRCLGFCETDYNDAPYSVSSFLKIRQQNYMLHRIFAWTKQEVVNSRLDAWSVGGSWYQMSIFFSVSCYVKLNSLRTLSKFNICIFWI